MHALVQTRPSDAASALHEPLPLPQAGQTKHVSVPCWGHQAGQVLLVGQQEWHLAQRCLAYEARERLCNLAQPLQGDAVYHVDPPTLPLEVVSVQVPELGPHTCVPCCEADVAILHHIVSKSQSWNRVHHFPKSKLYRKNCPLQDPSKPLRHDT